MLAERTSIDELMRLVEEDKTLQNATSYQRDRYPLRFVLFDNFADSFEFVDKLMGKPHVELKSVEEWIDPKYPDLMITYDKLADKIEKYYRTELHPEDDAVIAPFSELARFYDNKTNKTFEALLRTIKGIESTPQGWANHQRVYIPIVGLEGKMKDILPDTQITIWQMRRYFVPEEQHREPINYRMVLSLDTYGVKGLEEHNTMIDTVKNWLQVWKNEGVNTESSIICTSASIFANSIYAQPDNAFDYIFCNNVHDFLVKGLRLHFGKLHYDEKDDTLWRQLAEEIDVSTLFNFNTFVCKMFDVKSIDDYRTFIKVWFEQSAEFDRWLLVALYMNEHDDFLSMILENIHSFKDTDFIRSLATSISSEEEDMAAREYCLKYAAKQGVRLSEDVENIVGKQIQGIAEHQGYSAAAKCFTPISRREKQIAIEWLGNNFITPEEVRHSFPLLTSYMGKSVGIEKEDLKWVMDYIDAYKEAKVQDKYTDKVKTIIAEKNASELTFYEWYNKFSTTAHLLQGRDDIDIYYWIDGLGIDWIPFIADLIRSRSSNSMFLNEVMIGRAKLPTVTGVNKEGLQKLSDLDITDFKVGDLDKQAHQSNNKYPDYLINEMEIVSTAIDYIIQKYSGKKVAIVSDHGLTYLSQLCDGKNLGGVSSDHYGRIAKWTSGKPTTDNHYVILEDGKTTCALRHESLCAKTPKGQGAHGGCTPEEVLVPVFVISSHSDIGKWTAEMPDSNVDNNNAVVTFIIKNRPAATDLFVTYNGSRYDLHEAGEYKYTSSPLLLNADVKEVELHIGDAVRHYPIDFSLAADVDDNMFDF
jgi:hypothetical protein